MKKVLSIALAVLMLLAAVPTVALAVTYIDNVDIDFVTPEIGATAITDYIIDEEAGYGLKEAKWIDSANGVTLTSEDTFAEGEYILEATFEAKEGYLFKKAESVAVTINGVQADTVEVNPDGTLTATLSFTCEKGGIKIPSIATLIANIKIVLDAFARFIGSLLGLK